MLIALAELFCSRVIPVRLCPVRGYLNLVTHSEGAQLNVIGAVL
jgi:hypothetical protein